MQVKRGLKNHLRSIIFYIHVSWSIVVEEYITEIGRDAKFDTKKDKVHGRTGAELKWMNVVGKLDAQCRAPESVGSMV